MAYTRLGPPNIELSRLLTTCSIAIEFVLRGVAVDFWVGVLFELFSGAGGREFHFILYIFSLLFGGLPFSLLKKKTKL